MNATLIIIILTVLTSIVAFSNQEVFYRMKFNAYLIHHNRQWGRFFTHAFLHADWMHLLVNMFVLWSFGGVVEDLYGIYFAERGLLYFVLLYIGGILFSTLPAYGKHKNNDFYNAVGASGAVSAVLFASIIMFPQGEIIFIFLPVPIPAYVFGVLYLIYSAYMAKRGGDNVAHDVHFWGAIFGLVFTVILDPSFALNFFDKILN